MDPRALAPADVDERVVHMVRAACALIIAAERPVTTGDVASLLRQADPDGCALVKIANVGRVIVSLGVRTVGMWSWREISGAWHLGIDYRTEDDGCTRYACGLLAEDPFGSEYKRSAEAPGAACPACAAFARTHLEENARPR
jgi:hypothetical protein